MKYQAVHIEKHGSPAVIQIKQEDFRTLKEDEILIKHKASAINFIDIYHRSGLYPLPTPHGLGVEGTGVIEDIGNKVTLFRPGDRVAYLTSTPTAYAEFAYVPSTAVVKVPDTISLTDTAAIFMKGITVLSLFHKIESIPKGSLVYLTAGSGGIGLLMCQYAKHLGIDLIATASTKEKCTLMQNNGARFSLNYTTEPVVERVKEITHGRGVAVVLDSCGNKTFHQSLQLIKPQGMFISFGSSTGDVPPFDLQLLAKHGSIKITRASVFNYIANPQHYQELATQLFTSIEDKILKIHLHQPNNKNYTLSQAHQAHQALEAREKVGSAIIEY